MFWESQEKIEENHGNHMICGMKMMIGRKPNNEYIKDRLITDSPRQNIK